MNKQISPAPPSLLKGVQAATGNGEGAVHSRLRRFVMLAMRHMMTTKNCTAVELADAIGCRPNHADNLIRDMWRHRIIYIHGYIRRGNTLSRQWALRTRDQDDAPRPARATNSQVCKRYRQNIKSMSGEVRIGFWGL